MFNSYKYVIGAVLLVVFVSGSGIYFKYTQNKIEELQKENSVLTIANQSNLSTISKMKTDAQIISNANTALEENIKKANENYRKLQETFAKHDIEKLSNKKPVLMENVINEGTKKVFSELEHITVD